MLVHYFASLEVSVIKMDHTFLLLSSKVIYSITYASQGNIHSRTRLDDLLFVHNFSKLSVILIPHISDLSHPSQKLSKLLLLSS